MSKTDPLSRAVPRLAALCLAALAALAASFSNYRIGRCDTQQ